MGVFRRAYSRVKKGVGKAAKSVKRGVGKVAHMAKKGVSKAYGYASPYIKEHLMPMAKSAVFDAMSRGRTALEGKAREMYSDPRLGGYKAQFIDRANRFSDKVQADMGRQMEAVGVRAMDGIDRSFDRVDAGLSRMERNYESAYQRRGVRDIRQGPRRRSGRY